jgi:hypothetical protein
MGRMTPGARISARLEAREGGAALTLTLPPGAEPLPETQALLAGAGRLETGEGGVVLGWDRG